MILIGEEYRIDIPWWVGWIALAVVIAVAVVVVRLVRRKP
jgi:hypothetical protein